MRLFLFLVFPVLLAVQFTAITAINTKQLKATTMQITCCLQRVCKIL